MRFIQTPGLKPQFIIRRLSGARFHQLFKVGRQLSARVVRSLGQKNYLIRLGPYNFVASSSVTLAEKELINVEVLANKPFLHLKILSSKSARTSKSRPGQSIDPDVTREFAQTAVLYLSLFPPIQQLDFHVNYYPKARQGEKPLVKQFSLFVDFEKIGRTEIRIAQLDNAFKVVFLSHNSAWLGHLKQDVFRLEQILARSLGEKSVAIEFSNVQ